MARVDVDARVPSPILSTTDSFPIASGSHRSSTGSKESPSTPPTSISSNHSETMEKPVYPIFTKAAAAAQSLKRKLPQATEPSIASTSLVDDPRPPKKTRPSPETNARNAVPNHTNVPSSKPVVSTQNRSSFLATVLRDSPPVPDLSAKAPTYPVEKAESEGTLNDMKASETIVPEVEIVTPVKKRATTKTKTPTRKSPRVAKRKTTSVVFKASVLKKGKKSALKNTRTLRQRASLDAPKKIEAQQDRKPAPAKKSKISVAAVASPVKSSDTTLIQKRSQAKKTWLSHGLYVGQKRRLDGKKNAAKNNPKLTIIEKRLRGRSRENTLLPLPMFSGEQLLERGRDFKLPFDVFNPLPRGQPKPDEWWKKQSNRFVGDAAIEWKKTKPLPPSQCLCTPDDGCNEDCHNRYMLYECDETNCAIGPEFCTNRAFAELKVRRESGKKYDMGVEVLKTADKGFGVRACRTFAPNQVIVEYTGEIITQEECERRMREEYKENECYYLMTFDQNMIIDATRGSIARFVNHSCAPNCRMTKWVVAGKPRMALFAGDHGIMTGEELTYDYNFDPFSQKNVQECRCGAPLCRGILGPKPSKEKEAKLKEMAEKAKDAVVAGAKRKLSGMLGNNDDKAKPKPKKQKPKGTGIWAGKWEWVKK